MASLYLSASPYLEDVLALPVTDINEASNFYCRLFGMKEVSRKLAPRPQVILEREGVRIGFEENGGDAAQAGAAILVSNAVQANKEIENAGLTPANWQVDERNGKKFQVFFVVAPDGLCFYFYQELA